MASANVDKQSTEEEISSLQDDKQSNKPDLTDQEDKMHEAVSEDSKNVPLEPLNTPWTFWIDR